MENIIQISMSVRLTMVAVNKSVTIQLDHLSAHVIRVIAYHLMVQTVLVSCIIIIIIIFDKELSNLEFLIIIPLIFQIRSVFLSTIYTLPNCSQIG